MSAGLEVALTGVATLGLSYTGQIGDGADDHGLLRGDFTVRF